MRTCPEADRAKVTALTALRDRLDPFLLSQTIDRKLEGIYALANHRHSPKPPAPADGLPVAAPPPIPSRRQRRLQPLTFGRHATNYDRRRLVTS